MRDIICICLVIFLAAGCSRNKRKLPVLGTPVITDSDTAYPVIRPFSFISQDSLPVTEKTFSGKIYIADFIFLSCPTICPKMTAELLKVYDKYKNNPHILFISHTIDPDNDSIALLKSYSERIGTDSRKWFFVTGNKDSIYSLAEESYFTVAYADSTAPGGYVHGGGMLLIDTNRHIRGVYDGTDPKETQRLINDVALLLQEQMNN